MLTVPSVPSARSIANAPVKDAEVIIAFNTMRDARKHWYVQNQPIKKVSTLTQLV